MKGFFRKPDSSLQTKRNSITRKVRGASAPGLLLSDEDSNCSRCGLYRQVKSPKMEPTGDGGLNTLIIAEAPGFEEDQEGIQLVGRSGSFFSLKIQHLGFNLKKDFWKINAVNCRPSSGGSNRTPTNSEILYCRPKLFRHIRDLSPKFIILLGSIALRSFLDGRSRAVVEDLSITRWRGCSFFDRNTGARVYSTFHPSYVLRDESATPIFGKDLYNIMKDIQYRSKEEDNFRVLVNSKVDWKDFINPITSFDEISTFLKRLYEGEFGREISFDYETNCINPKLRGSKIFSIGVGVEEEGNLRGYSFPLEYPGLLSTSQIERVKKLWTEVLTSPNLRFICHNLQFEEKFNRELFKVESNVIWDTMITSHIIDDRNKFTILEFQVFLDCGYEYGDNILPFKKGNPYNRMGEVPLEELLVYNGLDAFFTKRLKMRQEEYINRTCPDDSNGLLDATKFFTKGSKTFVDLEQNGMRIDIPYFERQSKVLDTRIGLLQKELQNSEEAKLFLDKTGKNITINSNKDLPTLLYDILGKSPSKLTKGGGPSVDSESLETIDSPFVKKLLKVRKLQKQKSYLDQYLSLQIDNYIYPSFLLHTTKSYRSSSSSPNFQNIPYRDSQANRLIRSGFIPPEGFQIAEVDYGSMEVAIIACYYKDRQLIKERNEGFDPHGFWAEQLGLVRQKPFKEARFDAKNAFVFPLFYGSWYKSIWEDLRSRGYSISESEVQYVVDKFWMRYREAHQNMVKSMETYNSTGFITMPMGFRRSGHLTRNKIYNTPIQGTAFHCLLWSLNKVNDLRKKEGWRTVIPGQIHDCIWLYIWPEEKEHVVKTITRVMTQDIRKELSWLTVPLLAEWEICEVGESWFCKKELKI